MQLAVDFVNGRKHNGETLKQRKGGRGKEREREDREEKAYRRSLGLPFLIFFDMSQGTQLVWVDCSCTICVVVLYFEMVPVSGEFGTEGTDSFHE